MSNRWRIENLIKVNIKPEFLQDWMPVFEEGNKVKEERAFFLVGSRDKDSIKIEDFKKVPKSNCEQNRFKPFSREYEERFRKEKEKLGYLHLHPFQPNVMKPYLNFQIQLSSKDAEEMIKRKEMIRGIAHIMPSRIRNRSIPVHGIISFYGNHYPRTLRVKLGEYTSSICCFLRKENDHWKVLS